MGSPMWVAQNTEPTCAKWADVSVGSCGHGEDCFWILKVNYYLKLSAFASCNAETYVDMKKPRSVTNLSNKNEQDGKNV